MNDKNEMMDLINAAKAEARSDKIRSFFIKNSKTLSFLGIGLFVAILILLALKAYNQSRIEKYSEMLHQSLIYQQIGESQKAQNTLKEIYNSSFAPDKVKSLAALRYGAFLLNEGKRKEALEVYKTVSDCSFCDGFVKDLGSLLLVKLWLNDDVEAQKEDLAARIKKIEDRSKALRYNISEQRALLELQNNNLEKSYQIFELIAKSPEASENLKTRANDGMKMVIEKGYVVGKKE